MFGKLWRAVRDARAGARLEPLPRDFVKAREAAFAERAQARGGIPAPAGEVSRAATSGSSKPGMDPEVRAVLEDLARARPEARIQILARLHRLGERARPVLPLLDRLARGHDRILARQADVVAARIRAAERRLDPVRFTCSDS